MDQEGLGDRARGLIGQKVAFVIDSGHEQEGYPVKWVNESSGPGAVVGTLIYAWIVYDVGWPVAVFETVLAVASALMLGFMWAAFLYELTTSG
jgi:hypothetical protein